MIDRTPRKYSAHAVIVRIDHNIGGVAARPPTGPPSRKVETGA
jgi:hypothetical protein